MPRLVLTCLICDFGKKKLLETLNILFYNKCLISSVSDHMWPVVLAWARTYAPYIVMPAAGIVGFIGEDLTNEWGFFWLILLGFHKLT